MGGRGTGVLRGGGPDGLLTASYGLLSPDHVRAETPPRRSPDKRYGAYQTYEQGREASVSCACHWTVNKAASAKIGLLSWRALQFHPCGIFVPRCSAINAPEDPVDVPVHVGYQSELLHHDLSTGPFLPGDRIKPTFGGSPPDRVDQLLDGSAAAATVFGAQYYLMEQLGFRKIVDATFMIAAMVPRGVELDNVRRYLGRCGEHRPTSISRINPTRGITRLNDGTAQSADRCAAFWTRRAFRV